ncbi:MAG: L-serine ammonia-lyase, iron-sulfur-dependent, subunit alpha [Lawsonibacter sp.]|nr:L-serine ammonia-lyase, iron-sulfur-dependent, subunit alpha [Lawsonibacter sp.]
MTQSNDCYQTYLQILQEELIPAMGCTEPIAIAYGASYARDLLGALPDSIDIEVSGNLIKNVKSVVVPNTSGLRGIPAAAAAGVVAGRTDRILEVISQVTEEQKTAIVEFVSSCPMHISLKNTPLTFDYQVTLHRGKDQVVVRIANFHTNIVYAAKNDQILIDRPVTGATETELTDRSTLNLRDILDFAQTVNIADIAPMLERQVTYNSAIAVEGLKDSWGAEVGRGLLERGAEDVELRARAAAAAGSDARMNGCEMPVVIVSGSGNQGIAASVPVIEFARDKGVSHEKMLRALAVSDLVTIHQKTSLGRLSAFCGAVSAGAGAAAGICWLEGGDYDMISSTITNALAVSSGMVCDGAKSSCAGKIALAVESGLTGWHMAQKGHCYSGGDGLVGGDVEQTIANVGKMGHDGMRQTDREILQIMTSEAVI